MRKALPRNTPGRGPVRNNLASTAPLAAEEANDNGNSTAAAAAAAAAAAESIDETSPSSLHFTLTSCALPSNLATFLRVRLLTREEAQTFCDAAKPPLTCPVRGGKVAASAARSFPSAPPASLDISALSTVLLDDASPFVSAPHKRLVQRVAVELLLSRLQDPKALGRSSMQEDLGGWSHTDSIAHGNAAAHALAPLSYVSQQALLLRLTHKRLLFSLIAHTLAD